jgi:hypothetical protein
MNGEFKNLKLSWPNSKALSQNSPGGSEKNLIQDSRYPGRDFKPGPQEYEAGVLITRRRRSM